MLKQFGESPNEIYQENFLKVAVTLFTAFYQQKASTSEMLKQFGVSTDEIYQEGFLKVPVLNRSTKGATISSFCRAPCSQPSIIRKRAKIKCLSNLE